MDEKFIEGLYVEYQIPREGNLEGIYNCKGYWRMRQDLLEGKLEGPCAACTRGTADYELIKDQLKLLALKDELERLKSENRV